jgi:hypothetical protein
MQGAGTSYGQDRLWGGYGAGAGFPWKPPQLPSALADRCAHAARRMLRAPLSAWMDAL